MTSILDGAANARDLGGLPLRGGGVTRAGVFLRSDALGRLTPVGVDQLSAGPVGTVVDLRTSSEADALPDRLPDDRDVQTVRLSILQGAIDLGALPSGAGPDSPQMQEFLAQIPSLIEVYSSMLRGGANAFADLARTVAAPEDSDHGGVLIHCTAGKDRTGVATAVILDAVGVERDAVVADYASSQDNLAGAWAQGMLRAVEAKGVPLVPPLVELLTHTPAAVIRQALEIVDEMGGGGEYLLSGGLTQTELTLLRERLRAS